MWTRSSKQGSCLPSRLHLPLAGRTRQPAPQAISTSGIGNSAGAATPSATPTATTTVSPTSSTLPPPATAIGTSAGILSPATSATTTLAGPTGATVPTVTTGSTGVGNSVIGVTPTATIGANIGAPGAIIPSPATSTITPNASVSGPAGASSGTAATATPASTFPQNTLLPGKRGSNELGSILCERAASGWKLRVVTKPPIAETGVDMIFRGLSPPTPSKDWNRARLLTGLRHLALMPRLLAL